MMKTMVVSWNPCQALRVLESLRTPDPCGERGEFHTFVRDAPNFTAPIAIALGEIVHRDGFVFADLLPANSAD